MRTRLIALALGLALIGACGVDKPRFTNAQVPTSVVGSTSTSAPATTAPPTTAVPVATTNASLAAAKAVLSSTGIPLAVTRHDVDGVEVLTPCENTVKLGKAAVIATPNVILDPGHGGEESGAVGYNGLTEKSVNFAVARDAKAELATAGVSSLLTRTGDYRMSLTARAKLVTALKPRAFVSIHHNSDPDGPHDGPGSETYYQVASNTSAESKRLAGLIYEEVVKALRAYNVAWVGDTDAGAKYRQGSSGDDYYAVLRQTKGVVASLAELSFISNPPEADLLAQDSFQHVEAAAVARGIVRFLKTSDPGSGYTTPYARTTPAGGGGKAGCTDPPL